MREVIAEQTTTATNGKKETTSIQKTLKPSKWLLLPLWIMHVGLAIILLWALLLLQEPAADLARSFSGWTNGRLPQDFALFRVLSLIVIAGCLAKPLWETLKLKCVSYEITSSRLLYNRGVFKRESDQIELSRIRDLSVSRSLFERMFRIGTIQIESADRTHPHLEIEGQPTPYKTKDWIHHLNVEKRREAGYREFEGTQHIGD